MAYGRMALLVLSALIGYLVRPARAGDPAGTTFIYQGQLKQNGAPVSDSCAFEFTLWSDPFEAHPAGQVAPPLLFDGPDALEVIDGLFTALLDFGDGAFNGEDRWLEVAVRCSTDVDYMLLWPRQPLTAAPFASFAKQAPWQGLIGIPPDIADGDRDTRLSEAQVEDYVTNGPLNLAAGSTLSGQSIATGPHTTDTNAGTICSGSGVFLDGEGDCVHGGDGHSLDAADGSPADALYINNSGNVGIGSLTPTAKLDVAGTVRSSTGGFKFPDGTVQTTAAVGSGSLWSANGSNVYYNAGNVGIGTDTPGQRLSVAGRIESTSLGFKFPDGTSQATAARWTPSGSSLWYAGGNVGISTTSPAVKLDVGGIVRVNGDVWPETGWGLELAYNVTYNRGVIQAYKRSTGTWGDLYLGDGSVGIGSGVNYDLGKLVIGNSAGVGIEARGTTWSAHFKDANGSGEAWLAGDDGEGREYGIQAQGSKAGGLFYDANGSAEARVAYSDPDGDEYGVWASGARYGGHFNGHFGIDAEGDVVGGMFTTHNGNAWAYVATENKKISGTGSVSFVQNHPRDKARVIVYTAPEGDEVATYTRGTARLVDGVALVVLGESFKWVTNPDIGLTAYVTPRGACEGLYVDSLTSSEMAVRELRGGTSNIIFDYIVYGLRAGFEESCVVQEKEREAYLPSMESVQRLYERHPELREYNAYERFVRMRKDIGDHEPVDLTEAHALRDAIQQYDPSFSGLVDCEETKDRAEDLPSLRHADPASEAVRGDEAHYAPPTNTTSPSRADFEALYKMIAQKDAQIEELYARLARLEQRIGD